ncbi:late embryogenesis abundant protein [Zea mays]|uniref:Late embryogeneis abundant protein n=1 Tax=Zea mays TaxID=4577 RepID=B6SK48_MAIZE|nr:late embryogenesis abundant protein [Zea mays]ACG25231.1 late embryogenesis abundant protein [Zea mays]AQK93124.1 Late embryogeneis abundant protein [Zea mays]|eukprot:NP_001335912.1 late embryogenesis abundant protein [Zea mays]
MHRNPRAVIRAAVSLTRRPPAVPAAEALQTLPKATPSPALGAWRPDQAVGPLGSVSRRRAFSSSAAEYGKDVDEVNRKFAEAREEIEAAMESKETVYFNEEASIARDAANEALAAFDALLARLPPTDADALRRSMGLKMEQLKAELKQLED